MSEKEDKEGHFTQHLTQQQREPNPATTGPPPPPPPRREGRNHRDTPNVLPLVAYDAIYGCITRCPAHFVSLFVYIESSVKYVHSVILCLYVIMSINIKAQSGPSPIPSPVGRGVITEIPLSACCSLFTVLVGLM